MPESPRGSSTPWIAASVAGVVLLALLMTYLLALRDDEQHADQQRTAARQRVGQLTPVEQAAMNAAGTEMINLVTFSRAHFADDFQRALNGATGSLRTDVQNLKTKTLDEMTRGKFDLYGRLTHKALEGPAEPGKATGYTVLVTINGYRTTTPDSPIQQNLAVTVVQVNGKWLANDVTNIGVQS